MPRHEAPSVEQRLAELEQGFKVLSSALVTSYGTLAGLKHGLSELAGETGEVAILTSAGPLKVRLAGE